MAHFLIRSDTTGEAVALVKLKIPSSESGHNTFRANPTQTYMPGRTMIFVQKMTGQGVLARISLPDGCPWGTYTLEWITGAQWETLLNAFETIPEASVL